MWQSFRVEVAECAVGVAVVNQSSCSVDRAFSHLNACDCERQTDLHLPRNPTKKYPDWAD